MMHSPIRTRSMDRTVKALLEKLVDIEDKLRNGNQDLDPIKDEMLNIREGIEKLKNEEKADVIKQYNQVHEILKESDEKIMQMKTPLKTPSFNDIVKLQQTQSSPSEKEDRKLSNFANIVLQTLREDLQNISEDIDEDESKAYYQTIYADLEVSWRNVDTTYTELLREGIDLQFLHNEVSQLRKRTRALKIQLKEKMQDSSQPINLPKVTIPIFYGEYEKWTEFADIFTTMVHKENRLSSIEKMKYLKNHIKGDAGRIIENITMNGENYNTAWELIKQRYENKRFITKGLMDKLLDIPKIQNESASQMKNLHDTMEACLRALQNMKYDTREWDPFLIALAMRKWDIETRKEFEKSIKEPHELPSWKFTIEFMRHRYETLESISRNDFHKNKEVTTPNSVSDRYNKGNSYNYGYKTGSECPYCKQQHRLKDCRKFSNLSPLERNKIVRENKTCVNCLAHSDNRRCLKPAGCTKCSKPHHSLLHNETKRESEKNIVNNHNNKSSSHHASTDEKTGLLATAMVRAATDNHQQLLRVLIDTGSQVSFITEEAAQKIGCTRQNIRAEVVGLGESQPKVSNWKTEVQLIPRWSSEFFMNTELIIMKKLTKPMPQEAFKAEEAEWQNTILADPTYNTPGQIDIILGVKEYSQIIKEGIKKAKNGILAQNTEFGWILSGHVKKNSKPSQVYTTAYEGEQDQLTKFWEMEEIPPKREISQADEECEKLFLETTKRNKDGIYTVKMPFKEEIQELGKSRAQAAARFIQLEKKFQQRPELKKEYTKFIEEYEALGHMKRVPNSKEGEGKYYIPHQAVIREDSTTTKLRVVFDASSKTSSGKGLNQEMHAGPKLQQELSDILLRWRTHKIALSADIEKMYRQIKIFKEDQEYHRILWRTNPKKPFKEYELTTLTYGTAAAPYLAIRTIQQLAQDEKQNYPEVHDIVLHDFYVDDLLSGANTVQQAIKIQTNLIQMMKAGGFNLRKWYSNDTRVMEHLPKSYREEEALEISEDKTKKSLGIHWSPTTDKIKFKVNIVKTEKITKRHILSEVAKIFDPIGWIAPVVTTAKILIQQLWIQGKNWDEQIPDDMKKQWIQFQDQLIEIEKITIPRWIQYNSVESEIELHGFCDASEKAYGAVIYSKITNKVTNKINISLLTAKSKVAPTKNKISLPRLELCAAVLLARLIQKTKETLKIEIKEIHAWSDSMITLAWIQGEASRWNSFVANRTNQINKTCPEKQWHHVKTDENPADAVSRGINPSKMKDLSLWWNGPAWLENNNWKKDQVKINSDEVMQERKNLNKLCNIAINDKIENESIISRFSTLSRMQRVISYCKKFITQCQQKQHSKQEHLTFVELQNALLQIVTLTQKTEFAEYEQLRKNAIVNKNSKIFNLTPFLDEKGIIRVGGRLKNAPIPYNEKHPMIIPPGSHLATLIIRDAHEKTLHGGNQQVVAYIRRKYWIPNLKRSVKKILRQCTKCIRFKGETLKQIMGNLPKARVTPSPPFTHTGIDYAGPIHVRTSKGRGQKSHKGYIAVFVCLSTKAIHLEIVSDMTTETFLAALKRFTARRGTCVKIYSDNGTNFVGADRWLQKETKKIEKNQELQNNINSQGIQWNFIPPGSPHFGGLWEAGVKSMKHHMKRVIGESKLTYEELTTLTAQIEACLNSRPIYPLPDEDHEIQALTPGHFLIGRPILNHPEIIHSDDQSNLGVRWKLVQQMKKDFWKSWSTEYLNRLQQRYKWKNTEKEIKMGDVVLLKEEGHPSRWPLAKVTEVFRGNDDKIRVVNIEKAGGTVLKRAITNLIPLQMNENESNERTEEKDPKRYKKKTRSSSKNVVTTLLLMLITLVTTSETKFTITHPPSGIYVEHMGQAKVERGIFKIEAKIEKIKINQEIYRIEHMIQQMDKVCTQMHTLSTDTPCKTLVDNLREQEQEAIDLYDDIKSRQKRGALGNLLQYVFGVNDEVYQDINKLDKNQQEMIHKSYQQTKLMLKTEAAVNETEARMIKKLNSFEEKLRVGNKMIQDDVEMAPIRRSEESSEDEHQELVTPYFASNQQTVDAVV